MPKCRRKRREAWCSLGWLPSPRSSVLLPASEHKSSAFKACFNFFCVVDPFVKPIIPLFLCERRLNHVIFIFIGLFSEPRRSVWKHHGFVMMPQSCFFTLFGAMCIFFFWQIKCSIQRKPHWSWRWRGCLGHETWSKASGTARHLDLAVSKVNN